MNSPVRSPRHPGSEPSDESTELAELGLAPFEVEVDGHVVELGRTGHGGEAGLHLHNSGVGEIEAYVSTRRLTPQAHAPVARLFLPEGEVGIDEGIRQFFKAVLDVDARIRGLKVGKRARTSGTCSGGLGGRVEKSGSRFQRPSRLRTRLRLASSTLMLLISRLPRQSERSRMEVVTEFAWSTGSAPNAGSSSTVRLVSDKAGPGQYPQIDGGEVHGPAKGIGYKLRDLAFIAANAEQGRHDQHGQDECQRREGD